MTIQILKNRGFTLVELLITIVMLAVVMMVAIPNFTAVIKNDSISSTNNKLIASLMLARSEAIKRGTTVSICATADSNYNSCGSNWQLGWLVFVNPTGGTTLSNTAAAPLLRVEAITDTGITISTAPSINIASYNSSGFAATGTGNAAFTIKATGCTADSGRQIAISMTGNPTVTPVNCP